MMRKILSCLTMLAMFTGPLHAQTASVETSVFVERTERVGNSAVRTVENIDALRSGDRVVTVLRWNGSGNGSLVTSTVPPALAFENASATNLEVSRDGGRTWRRFSTAGAHQVTHFRWRVSPGAERLTYSAIVR